MQTVDTTSFGATYLRPMEHYLVRESDWWTSAGSEDAAIKLAASFMKDGETCGPFYIMVCKKIVKHRVTSVIEVVDGY